MHRTGGSTVGVASLKSGVVFACPIQRQVRRTPGRRASHESDVRLLAAVEAKGEAVVVVVVGRGREGDVDDKC